MSKHFYTVFNLIALLVISYAAVNIFYSLVRINLQQDVPFSAVVPPEDTAGGQLLRTDGNTRSITERNLFDSVEPPAADVGIDEIAELEPTDLKVRLLGTVAGSEESARAFIMDEVKMTQNIYRQGDTIQNAVLVKILRSRVVLRVGEQNQMLSMEENAGTPEPAEERPKPRDRDSSRETAASPAEQPRRERGNTSLNRNDLQNSYNEFEEMLKQGDVEVNLVDGEKDGLVINLVPEGSFFAKLGLTKGDILHGVNNQPIANPEDAKKIYRTMKTSSLINVQLTRDGKKKIITYYLR